jgi:gamma-glutamylcyclotransferase (GGCT)/AIG2-like uncharacterized protein YtfP
MSNEILVAVYGTLKQGNSNHELLSGSSLVGIGTTPPNYTLLEMGSYPGAIFGQSKLLVEVFSVDQRTLERLDQLEGHPSFYERLLVPIKIDGSETVVKAWMYTIGHLGSNYSHRPKCTNFDDQNRIDWEHKREKNTW